MQRAALLAIVEAVIDELNELKSEEEKIQFSEQTLLYGQSSPLDSVDLVNLLLAIEEQLEDEHDISFTIANEKAMSMRNSPFKTVSTLIDYLMSEFE